jgi:ParB-like chromosome segregation protein Spo0J
MVNDEVLPELKKHKWKWKLELVPLSKITFHKQAYDRHKRSGMAGGKVVESIKANGLIYYPFLNTNYEVLDGIERILALKALHVTHVLCYIVDIDPSEYQDFIIAANHRKEKSKSETFNEALTLVRKIRASRIVRQAIEH